MTEHELVWIIDGQVEWTVDGVIHRAPPGSLLLVRPGMRESYRWDPRRITRHAYVHFRVADAGDLPLVVRWPALTVPLVNDVVRPLAGQLLGLLARRPANWQALADACLAHLIRSLAAGEIRASPDPALSEPLARAMRLVERRWAGGVLQPIAMGELAQAAGVSRVHLCRLFHHLTGRGALDALRALRLQHGAALLTRTDLTIVEVAACCGFTDSRLFSRRFTGRYAMSPQTWRRRARAGEAILADNDPRLSALAAQIGAA